MDPNAIERAITPRTRAVLPVHLHGRMAAMDSVMQIAGRHGLIVIEDAAQAHGARYRGRRAGSIGAIGCFSFYPSKNLGAYGEGGAVVTNDAAVAHKITILRDWGQESKYNHVQMGFNYRMDGIQGAVLDVKLPYVDHWTERRRAHARHYTERLTGLPIGLPALEGNEGHAWHVYAVRAADRSGLAIALQAAGVQTRIHYPIPVHLQKGYAHLGGRRGTLPITERLATEFLSLPIYAELTEAQIELVTETIRRY
jgi:dTDP-4-amino-4,6-dideoxygalactose transaminase